MALKPDQQPLAAAASGRAVVLLMQRLTREQGCTVLLVTNDSRILDIADHTLSLEDGRLC
jgi:putative ABC transport system ATP-binding protein